VPNATLAEIAAIIDRHENEILNEWVQRQMETLSTRRDLLSDGEIRNDSHNLLSVLRQSLLAGSDSDISRHEWVKVRDLLADLSRRRANSGLSPSETATFVFSLKEPLLHRITQRYSSDPQLMADQIWSATRLLDKLGLFTTEMFQKSREEVILRQQQAMLELSTPVIELWQGILAIPLIGTLDSDRTQMVMQNLLEAIVAKSAGIAIIDITGVPTVDTLVAQHLLKTVAAARLMGADCIISGIRPQIAQTIIHLGVDLGNVATKATLADALVVALRKLGLAVAKV